MTLCKCWNECCSLKQSFKCARTYPIAYIKVNAIEGKPFKSPASTLICCTVCCRIAVATSRVHSCSCPQQQIDCPLHSAGNRKKQRCITLLKKKKNIICISSIASGSADCLCQAQCSNSIYPGRFY